jgi:phosphatidylglycerophosphate synthase
MVDQPAPSIAPWARAPGTLSGAVSIAVMITASGLLLVHEADWRAAQIGTALATYAVLAVSIALAAAWHLNGRGFGLANQITLLRTGLVSLVGGALLGGEAHISWSLAAVIATALTLDAVDGWFARHFGLTSRFGARFDLEIDALMILILSALIWQTGRAGPWVLLIGAMRYGFVALGLIWRPARRPLPPSLRRKTACAVLGVLLLLCLVPPMPLWLAHAVAALGLSIQLTSFGIDLAWLYRHAAAEPA